jgi:hypothetical protein
MGCNRNLAQGSCRHSHDNRHPGFRVVTLVYVTVGGLWGVIVTDLVQFIVQVLGGIVMFVLVVSRLGGVDSITGIWKAAATRSQPVVQRSLYRRICGGDVFSLFPKL